MGVAPDDGDTGRPMSDSGQDLDEEDQAVLEDDAAPIDKLREVLARQILKIAIADPNAQLKLDAFKATERYATKGPAKADSVATPMANFQARVRRSEEMNGGEPTASDTRE